MEKESVNQLKLRKEAEKYTDPRADLAVERTELAWERTQLAWIRTTITFLAGGIGLDKGVGAMRKTRIESGDALFQNAHIIAEIMMRFCTLFHHRFVFLY